MDSRRGPQVGRSPDEGIEMDIRTQRQAASGLTAGEPARAGQRNRRTRASAWDVTEHPVRLADDGEWYDSQTRPSGNGRRRAGRPARCSSQRPR